MEFDPKYTITPKLLFNIKDITRITTELNNRRFPETIKMNLEKTAVSMSVYSSTSIEGNILPLTEVKKILKNKPEHARDSEKEIINYNDALIYLRKIMGKSKTFNKKLVLDVHKKVMKGLLQNGNFGDYRNAPVVVNNPRNGEIIYLPPDAKDVNDLMKALIDYVNKNKEEIDPIIIAGLFHKQFVIIHPFVDGNGRTVRLLTKLLLANMGLDTFNLFSFENYYNKNVTKYFQNVGVQGNYYEIEKNVDFTKWLEYFTDGIIDELIRVSKELEKFGTDPGTSLRDHDRKVLKHIEEYGYITDSEYSKLTDRAKSTRALDFYKLRKLGLIKRKGKGRATYYTYE
ncbi:Fic family protein [Patescibacteria group bacterium]|nr:Fic family protein [Patescibacteria group bacterium]